MSVDANMERGLSVTKGDEAGGGDSGEARRRQRMRSIAIALLLAFLVGLFYAATIVRLGGNALNRPM